ncbi:PREDICTED: iron-sulfur assembly protein IscA, chloroplastic-like [Tarenaya hassleriana]|uniref:iron-sulfur assembly protein IscA, chloroplastic-like n=1 Tax=Tarenaya hassleriana TaxID=28532 RepID=UPI00053C0ADD|nr:PREDICTED: iron-sulfur assembly protein IscA, chloroplastic-like [Tarenaya hassleriana]
MKLFCSKTGKTMASFGIATQNPAFLRLRTWNIRSDSAARCNSVSFRGSNSSFGRIKRLSVRSASAPVTSATEGVKPAISLTDNALKHLNKMRSDRGEDLCLRIGVKQGGCSGMSYTMDLENRANARPDDSIIEYEGFTIVCDPKSLLFLFGMQLDYSDSLIGGGFSFKNPNATQTCGCGKSFAADM